MTMLKPPSVKVQRDLEISVRSRANTVLWGKPKRSVGLSLAALC